jgi:hypothetical protein
MIVSLLALAAVATIRVGRLHVAETRHSIQAQLNANAALEIALHRIENNPTWRNDLATSAWDASTPLDEGTFRISGTDPIDDNLLDDDYEPVKLEVSGASGPANHRLGVELRTQMRGIRSLEAALHSGGNLTFTAANPVTSNGIVSANGSITGSTGSHVTADFEAATTITGGTFVGPTTTSGEWPRDMPDQSDVFSYYLANGTVINANDLPLLGKNLLSNPGFENGTTGWEDNGDADIESEIDLSKVRPGGIKSIRVKSRDGADDGIRSETQIDLQTNGQYQLKAWIYTKNGGDDNFRIGIRTLASIDTPLTGWFPSLEDDWIEISVNFPWTQASVQGHLFIESKDGNKDFWVDDVLFRKNDDEANARSIDRILISPTSFLTTAGNQTNAQGIYVIQCAGQRLVIRNSRIVGTLVVIDPGPSSRVEEAVNWQPKKVDSDNPADPNMPALLVNAPFNIVCSVANLTESGSSPTNFNPSETPYPYPSGAFDANMGGSYPCLIRGIVYTTGHLTIFNASKFDGVVLSAGNISVNGANSSFKYDPIYLEQNPPPGFRERPQFEIVPRSITRIVD